MDREEMIRTLAARLSHGSPSASYRWSTYDRVTRMFNALDELFGEGWFIGTPTDREVLDAMERSTYSEWQVVNRVTESIFFTLDATTYGAKERAEYWLSKAGEGYVLEHVTYETWTTPARRVALNGTAAGSEATENKP